MGGLSSLVVYMLFFVGALNSAYQPKFKGAIHELAPTLFPECLKTKCGKAKALDMMRKNVDKIRKATKEAASEGAKIIVFPEYGITGDVIPRELIEGFTQELPMELPINLCNEEGKENMEILRELSCVAMESKIYVVANVVIRSRCHTVKEDWCIYNTNVAFSNQGELVSMYKKYNLFGSEVHTFDQPPEVSVAIFDTDFGKFGMMTCFDVMFEEPGLSIVRAEAHSIAFPTYWLNAAPLLTGIQVHSSWAYNNGVNFLASQNHGGTQTGSGVYSTDGVYGLYFDRGNENQSRLVVSEIPMVPAARQAITAYGKYANVSSTPKTPGSFSSNFELNTFQFLMIGSSGTARVCDGQFCCESSYSKDKHTTDETYALTAFSGMHHTKSFYLEMCAVIKCASSEPGSCGDYILEGSQKFTSIKLAGTFTSNNVFPSVLLEGKEGLDFAYDQMEVQDDGLLVFEPQLDKNKGLIAAQLFGRPYYKDPNLHQRCTHEEDEQLESCPASNYHD